MPPVRGAAGMGKIDGGFSCYVMLVRDAVEVTVDKRLGHVSFPEFLSAYSVKRRTSPVRGVAPDRSLEDRTDPWWIGRTPDRVLPTTSPPRLN